MFRQLFRSIFGRRRAEGDRIAEFNELVERAEQRCAQRDLHAAIELFERALQIRPEDVPVLNRIGCLYSDVNKHNEAAQAFAKAFVIDEKCIPAMVNHARLLKDKGSVSESKHYIEQAKLASPDFAYTDAIMASVAFAYGKTKEASRLAGDSWIGLFNELRFANAHLFQGIYDPLLGEQRMASEHAFWGETQAALDEALTLASPSPCDGVAGDERRCRIGYWSPDMHDHSVRYFFRPLLENHDPERFDVYLYHDGMGNDAQTAAIKAAVPADRYFFVGNLPDGELVSLMRSHQLDVLVELAGHTSANRLHLFQTHLATLTITGLGYPPTTGLSCIDAKILDVHVMTEAAERFYVERPLVMPESFWCFDPMQALPPPGPAPSVGAGYVVFACPGNIAKISHEMLACWRTILDRVPNSRLRIQAINFTDSAILASTEADLKEFGLPMDRVELFRPTPPEAFFKSYDEIDVVLDTRPFGGGTTVATALYMGVPVVSWVGESLVGRMGYSMLRNVGLSHLAVDSAEAYVEQAVLLAGDVALRDTFRREARDRMKATAFGNGARYARQFESACLSMLTEKRAAIAAGKLTLAPNAVPPLPLKVAVKRGYRAIRFGHLDGANRIAAYCVRHYPSAGAAHLLYAERFGMDKRYTEGIEYLKARLDGFDVADRVAARIVMARFALLADSPVLAGELLTAPEMSDIEDPLDRKQVRLLQAAACATAQGALRSDSVDVPDRVTERGIAVVVPCDDEAPFGALVRNLVDPSRWPEGWHVTVTRCSEFGRVHAYEEALRDASCDIVIFLQKCTRVLHPDFIQRVLEGLSHADMLSFAGAKHWDTRIDWRLNPFDDKAAGLLASSIDQPEVLEYFWQGAGDTPLVGDMAVLDGRLLAAWRTRVADVPFDRLLEEAETLLEEAWSHDARAAGCSLAVHRALGIQVFREIALPAENLSSARWHLAERYGFTAFHTMEDDGVFLSAPVSGEQRALALMDAVCFPSSGN